jgi:hypothetical protein
MIANRVGLSSNRVAVVLRKNPGYSKIVWAYSDLGRKRMYMPLPLIKEDK